MVAFRRKSKRRSSTRRTVRRANPRRKTRAKKRTVSRSRTTQHRPRLTKKGGKWYGGKTSRSLIRRGSGTRINPSRKRRRRRVRRNPALNLRRAFSQKMLMTTVKAGAGIAIGFAAMPLFYRILPDALKSNRKWLGGIHVALGLGIAGFIKNRDIKDVGLVIAATGVYDLIAMNVSFLDLPPLRVTSSMVDNMLPEAPVAPPDEAAQGCYGASYPTLASPVSRVAARGVGSSYERMGSSYPSLAYPTVGISGDLDMDGMIN